MNRKKHTKATRKRTDGGCTPIVENKFIPKPLKRYKVQVEMTITRVIEVEVNSVTPLSAELGFKLSKKEEKRWANWKYKVIGVEEIDA